MDNVKYTSRRLAELFGLTPKQVVEIVGHRDGFGPRDLAVLRKAVRRPPEPFPHRKQLFLNFKGGTGKTSLSTSYAYRLAERGYKVLVLDLDSQGHATRCLGEEGSSFTKTLYDVLVRKTPLAEVTIETKMPGLWLVPSNLAMSTVDLALMPMAGREFKLKNALRDAEKQLRLRGHGRAALVRAPQPERAHGGERPRHPGARRLPLLRRAAAALRDHPGARGGPLAPAREHLHLRERLQPDVPHRPRGASTRCASTTPSTCCTAWCGSAPSSPRPPARDARCSATTPTPRGPWTSRPCSSRCWGGSRTGSPPGRTPRGARDEKGLRRQRPEAEAPAAPRRRGHPRARAARRGGGCAAPEPVAAEARPPSSPPPRPVGRSRWRARRGRPGRAAAARAVPRSPPGPRPAPPPVDRAAPGARRATWPSARSGSRRSSARWPRRPGAARRPVAPREPARAAESALSLVGDLDRQLARSRELEEALRADLHQARTELARAAGDAEAHARAARRAREGARGAARHDGRDARRDDGPRGGARPVGAARPGPRRARRGAAEAGRRPLPPRRRAGGGAGRARAPRPSGSPPSCDERTADGARLRAGLSETVRERDALARELAAVRGERDELLEARRALEKIHEALSQARSRLG